MTQDFSSDYAMLSKLLRERLGLSGRSVAVQLAKGRRALPRALRSHADQISAAEPLLAHPHLARSVDHAALSEAVSAMQGYLKGCSAADRQIGVILHRLGVIAFNLLAIGLLLLIILRWRGLV